MSELFDLFPLPGLYIILMGYLLGSIPTAYWLAKFVYRINIFEHGSKNGGATNVHRVLGAVPFAITLTIDICKGVLAVLLAGYFIAPLPPTFAVKILGGASAIIGHTLSFWVSFRGGKGVATGLGVFLALAPLSSIGCLFIFLLTLMVSGFVSMGSIMASLSLPVLIFFFREGGEWSMWLSGFSLIIALFIVYKHKANIKRLMKGEELSLHQPKKHEA